jgi:hypothetical protein
MAVMRNQCNNTNRINRLHRQRTERRSLRQRTEGRLWGFRDHTYTVCMGRMDHTKQGIGDPWEGKGHEWPIPHLFFLALSTICCVRPTTTKSLILITIPRTFGVWSCPDHVGPLIRPSLSLKLVLAFP